MEQLPTLTQVATTAAITAYREYSMMLNSSMRLELYATLLELRLNTRTYYMDITQAQTLWALIRDNDDIMDFFVRGSVLFKLQFPESDTYRSLTYEQYVRQLGQAISSVSHGVGEDAVTDESFSSKLSESEAIDALLAKEGWLVYMLTLEMVMTSVVPIGVQRAWRSGAEVTDQETEV